MLELDIRMYKQFAATNLHFHLHGSAPLESLATSDNQSKVMSAEPGVRVRRVIIRKASRCHNDIDLDSRLEALFPKRQALQLVQSKLLGCAVDSGVFEQDSAHTVMIDCRLDRSAATKFLRVLRIFELPRVTTLVVQQAWVVITLVEVFEDAGKDLGLSVI